MKTQNFSKLFSAIGYTHGWSFFINIYLNSEIRRQFFVYYDFAVLC